MDAALPDAPAAAGLPRPLRLALAALAMLLAAWGLAAFVSMQHFPAHLVDERVRTLLSAPAARWDALSVLPWTLALLLTLWLALGLRRPLTAALDDDAAAPPPPPLADRLVRAAWALAPLLAVPLTLFYDDLVGRQVLAAALVGLTAYRVWPLLGVGDGHLHKHLPPFLRGVSVDTVAALLAVLAGSFLFFGALLRHEAQWSSLIDLGLFYEIYDHPGGELLYAPTIGMSFLGEHFSPVLVLLTPLMTIFPSPVTLLAVQAVAVALGGWFLYLFARDRTGSATVAGVIMLGYLLSPWVQAAAFYDFHMDMLEPPMLFGLALALSRRSVRWTWVSAVLLWCTKEDAFLYTTVLALWAAVALRARRLAALVVVVGLAQAAVVLGVVLPAMRPPYDPRYFSTTGATTGYAFLGRYSHLGGSLGAMVGKLAGDPLYVVDHLMSGARLTNLLGLVLSFGGLALCSWAGLWLLLPTLEMLLANPGPMSGFQFYYGAVAFMFAPLAAVEGARRLLGGEGPRFLGAPGPRRVAFGLGLVLLALLGWHPTSFLASHNTYKPVTYTSHQAQAEVLMARIPEGARVSATGYQAVHLQPGRDVRMFPYGLDDADYVLVDTQRPPWPRTLAQVEDELLRLPSRGFGLDGEGDGLFLLSRHPEADAAAVRARIRALLDAPRFEAELTEQTAFLDRVDTGDDASNGAFRSVGPDDRRGPDFLQYGPYTRLSPGAYDAVFRVRWREAGLLAVPPGQLVATVDVAFRHGSDVRGKRDLTAGELAGDGDAWREVRIPFEVRRGDGEVEGRVFFHDVGRFDLDYVAFEPRATP
ncbi:MAG: DUF2079 domain-containing protein [Myxococcales bacterium]|nr:DUF2079 domain-containing protein [Myxococcales bacterium]MCB9734340.1 DUF2079 domain-containing protein [Deltaproteobacteria bacterium]